MTASKTSLYRDFIWRRIHSFVGLWLVIYISMHLFTNSQAALLFGDDGKGFIRAVNSIHELPYLPVLEVVILVIPFFIHIVWGVQRLLTAKLNSLPTDGSSPSLANYSRNQAFTWQRITSWILIVGIAAHVIHMRFVEYPTHAIKGTQDYYTVSLSSDEGLDTVAERLDVQLYPIKEGQVAAVAKSFGTAELLMLRNVFKSPMMMILYTLLVVTACFHAFNGLWTFFITWGGTLSENSQKLMKKLTLGLMLFVTFLGLAAIWGTYWINLRQ